MQSHANGRYLFPCDYKELSVARLTAAGREARDLLAAASPSAGESSLREFCSQQRRFDAGECSYVLLSEQTHPLGSGTVSGFLFARTQPASYLTAMQARRSLMAGVFPVPQLNVSPRRTTKPYSRR